MGLALSRTRPHPGAPASRQGGAGIVPHPAVPIEGPANRRDQGRKGSGLHRRFGPDRLIRPLFQKIIAQDVETLGGRRQADQIHAIEMDGWRRRQKIEGDGHIGQGWPPAGITTRRQLVGQLLVQSDGGQITVGQALPNRFGRQAVVAVGGNLLGHQGPLE